MIEFRQAEKALLKIWKMPERGRRYLIPADVAEGLQGGNFSAAHVIDLESFEQVAVWHGLEEPYAFGKILYNLGEFYNGALLAPERNNNGISTIDYLRSHNYSNIYKMIKFEYANPEETERYGWMTNLHTRPLIIDSLKEAVRGNIIKINDYETLAELRTFVRNPKTGKVEAAPGSMDDLVISLGIGCYIRSTMSLNLIYETSNATSYIDQMRERWNQGGVTIATGRGGY